MNYTRLNYAVLNRPLSETRQKVYIQWGLGDFAETHRCGWGLFGHFYSFLSPSLREMARYRRKYCLKGPLNPKQSPKPTNQNAQETIRLNFILFTSCEYTTLPKFPFVMVRIYLIHSEKQYSIKRYKIQLNLMKQCMTS